MNKHRAILAACLLTTALTPPIAFAGQAPELEALVTSGALPPLEERLPKTPRVVTPEERVGTYGGTWRSSLVGGSDQIWLLRVNSLETLVSWDRGWTGALEPNVAESMEVSEDARVFTVKLREGMRWSDGTPFTADDIEYYFVDVLSNPELVEVPNTELWPRSGLPKFEKLDATTVRFTFAEPLGVFPSLLAGPYGAELVAQPKHYCAQFNPKYNPDAAAQAAAAGEASWAAYYLGKCMTSVTDRENFVNAERPTIQAWKLQDAYVGGAQQVTMVRNPYYWKVDTEGNQLPYINDMRIAVNNDKETVVLSALNGEIDFQDRNVDAIANRSLFAEGAENGPFRVQNMVLTSNTLMIALNLTTKDDFLREVLNTKDFRIALSHAIDRQSIVDAVNFGLGKPSQVAPDESTPYYNAQLATQYLAFDPAESERLLDAAGFERGPDGFRTAPDGRKITFVCSVANNFGDMIPTAELVVNYWQAIGIDAILSAADRTSVVEGYNNNDHDCAAWTNMTTGPDLVLDPRIMAPSTDQAFWGSGWAAWYGGAANAVEPPAEVKAVLDLYDQVKASATDEARIALMSEIAAIAAENFWVMGVSTKPPSFAVVNDDLANVPDPSIWGWNYLSPAASGVEQYFFDR